MAKAAIKTDEKNKFIWVRSGLERTNEQQIDGSDTVAFSEVESRHPNAGSCFVAGSTPVKAYPTAAILAAIEEGKLVKIRDDEEQ